MVNIMCSYITSLYFLALWPVIRTPWNKAVHSLTLHEADQILNLFTMATL
jgi:ABC-type arginine/histidine transport system permease subunit